MNAATKARASEILAKHADGWRFHIGWPYTHQPHEEPERRARDGRRLGAGGAVTENTGKAYRLTPEQWKQLQRERAR